MLLHSLEVMKVTNLKIKLEFLLDDLFSNGKGDLIRRLGKYKFRFYESI